jgi:hypothetical protein
MHDRDRVPCHDSAMVEVKKKRGVDLVTKKHRFPWEVFQMPTIHRFKRWPITLCFYNSP